MPNAFGNRPLLDPSKLLAACLDAVPPLPTYWFGEVTVAKCPPGREPGTAAFLMRYGDVRQLDKAADHTLNLSDGVRSIDLKRWTIREAFAPISGATALNDDTAYLVRAVDRRFHLRRSPFSKAYNVTTDGSTYVTSTTNSGTPWSWAGMFADLWGLLPSAGTAPTLPFTPHGTPQNFTWFGHPSAWDAINDLLDRLACIVCYDPVTDAFTVERLGSTDTAAEAFEAKAKKDGSLTFDTLPVAFERADKPESLKVVFRRYPAPSAGSDPTYAVTTSLGGSGVVAGTVVQIEDDACAIAATGTPTNSSYLAARAAERVADYKRKLQGFDRRLVRSYIGLWKDAMAAPGSTYAGLAFEDRGQAYRTELQAKPDARLEKWKAAVPVEVASGGGSLTVKESDGSPSYSGITSLEFDQAAGFVVSQPGSNRAKVSRVALTSGMQNVDNLSLIDDGFGVWVSNSLDTGGLTAGKYHFTASISTQVVFDSSSDISTGPRVNIYGRFYNVTQATEMPYGSYFLISSNTYDGTIGVTGVYPMINSGSMDAIIEVAEGDVVTLQFRAVVAVGGPAPTFVYVGGTEPVSGSTLGWCWHQIL